MSATEERPTGNLVTRTLIAVLALADLAACAMIGRSIRRDNTRALAAARGLQHGEPRPLGAAVWLLLLLEDLSY